MSRHFLMQVLVSAVYNDAKPWLFGPRVDSWSWTFLCGKFQVKWHYWEQDKQKCIGYPCFKKKWILQLCVESLPELQLCLQTHFSSSTEGLSFSAPLEICRFWQRWVEEGFHSDPYDRRGCLGTCFLPEGSGCYLAGAASPLCWHWAPRGPHLTCGCVGAESQFAGFPASLPGGHRKASVVQLLCVPSLWRSKNNFCFYHLSSLQIWNKLKPRNYVLAR